MDSFNKVYRYGMGIYEANVYSTGTDRSLLWHDAKLTAANLAGSVDVQEVLAGLGNTPQILMFNNARFDLTLNASDIDLRIQALQTGSELGYNGIVQTCEVITATTSTLTVSTTPAVPYGGNKCSCYINGNGQEYEINPTTKVIQGFTATSGTQYSVRYYVAGAANQVLDVKALYTPEIVSAEIKMPIYQNPVGRSAASGTLCGYLWMMLPACQNRNAPTLNAQQASPTANEIVLSTLSYDNPAESSCEASAMSSILYLVWQPIDQTENIADMVVLGGGTLSVKVGETARIPVKFIMKDGSMAQPDYADLTFVSSAQAKATVVGGVVTGVAAGDADITITYDDVTPALTALCAVTVTA